MRSVIPFNVHGPMRTWSAYFTVSSLLLLVFFWFETTSSTSLRFSWSLKRFRVAAGITLALLLVFELVSNGLYYARVETFALWYVAYALPIVYVAIGFAVALFFIVTTSRILANRVAMAQSADVAGKGVLPVAFKLLMIGMWHLVFLGVGLYSVSRSYVIRYPTHVAYFWVVLHTVINIRGALVVLLLTAPRVTVPKAGMALSATTSNVQSGGSQFVSPPSAEPTLSDRDD